MNWDSVIDAYLKWFKDNTDIKSINDGESCEITTPFLDRHNDHLQIYVLRKGSDDFLLTDDGYTIQDLLMSGMKIDTPKRKQLFQSILNGFGVKVDDKDRLQVEASMANIGQKKHALTQAVLAVNDMYPLSLESVLSFFKEDVEQYFRANEIYHSKDIKLAGKTGYDHNIDFLIPPSKNKPERLIKTINQPKKDYVMGTIFSFNDISAIREQESKNFVIYNDLENPVSQDSIAALTKYNITPIAWSQKSIIRAEFA